MRYLQGAVVHTRSKFMNFPAKSCFCKWNGNAEGQFLRSGQRPFLKVPILSGSVCYATTAKHGGWVERHDTNLHSKKQWDISKERSCTQGQSSRIFQPSPASANNRKGGTATQRDTTHDIFKVQTKAFLKKYPLLFTYEIVWFPLIWSTDFLHNGVAMLFWCWKFYLKSMIQIWNRKSHCKF